jgi:hypothetical protein
MKLVSDKIYNETLNRVKKYIKISSNPTNYNKKILINLMPTFAFKQLIIFTRLGEYLKKEGFYVDYLICNGVFNHCDMVKMNDGVDKKLICERCIKADEILNLKQFCIKPDIEIENKNFEKKYYENAIIRYVGDEIKFIEYEKETKDNLIKANNIKNLDYDFLIYLNHYQNYSIAPFVKKFKNFLSLGIAGGSDKKIYLFENNKEKIFKQKIKNFNIKKIENFLKNRIKITKQLEINSNKKIISFFPNLLEDAYEEDSNVIFASMLDWLKESIEIIKKDFFIILKAHPAEKSWKPTKSILDYFDEKEVMLVKDEYSAYEIANVSDYIVTYNGTIFYEGLVMNKKVILGGKIGDIFHKSKEEYFNQFCNYQPYDYKKAMEYAYKIIFTKTFPLKMIDENLKYPYIKEKEEFEIAFKSIKDIIERTYDVNNYLENFISQY